MANRVEITETVESATGLNITGAQVTVKYRGGAQAPVYDAQNGGALLTQPLATVNGKIGADSPSGAWVAEGDYDLLVTFGSDTLTYAWTAAHPPQFVTTLPAGAGTSAPEDGEQAIELYDATNGGAWLRRYRAAAVAWDMVGGPPPAGAALPGSPRARQEFYLTGGSPAVQHQRYNGSAWEYVGTPPMVPVTGSPLNVLDTGQANQIRAGRQLALADFTTLCGLPTTPIALYNLGSVTNLGSAANLVNKGTVTFGLGIEGVAAAAAQFTGSTAQALYVDVAGGSASFNIRQGSWGCWVKTAKRGTSQNIMAKDITTAGQHGYGLNYASNAAGAYISLDGTAYTQLNGTFDVQDDRWHFIVATFDGAQFRLYVDGVLDAFANVNGLIFAGTSPFNIGGAFADSGVATNSPHAGRIDEAFVLADVLSEDQIRLLYAAKIVHGYSVTPRLAALGVRRKRRGAALVSADFPSQPKRLHNFTAGVLTDLGSDNQTLTNNNAAVVVPGADGSKDGAFNFITGSSQSLSATDTGLPAALTSRSMGCWFKTAGTGGNMRLVAYGTHGTNDMAIGVLGGNGNASGMSGADTITGPAVVDGLWHHLVLTEDNAPTDLVKRKLYLDGRLIGASLTLNSLTLIGANGFRIGSNPAAGDFFTGQIDGVFVFSGVLSPEQIGVLYQKSAQALAQSIKEPGAHIEAIDATNVYAILDTIDSNNSVDLAVAA